MAHFPRLCIQYWYTYSVINMHFDFKTQIYIRCPKTQRLWTWTVNKDVENTFELMYRYLDLGVKEVTLPWDIKDQSHYVIYTPQSVHIYCRHTILVDLFFRDMRMEGEDIFPYQSVYWNRIWILDLNDPFLSHYPPQWDISLKPQR